MSSSSSLCRQHFPQPSQRDSHSSTDSSFKDFCFQNGNPISSAFEGSFSSIGIPIYSNSIGLYLDTLLKTGETSSIFGQVLLWLNIIAGDFHMVGN